MRLPKLNPAQRAALEEFAWLRMSGAELAATVRGALDIDLSHDNLHVRSQVDPFEKIPFTWMHIENALECKKEGRVTTDELSVWARLILALCPPYDLEEERQEELAEWLWMFAYDIPATEEGV